jgi:hypothetical protein
MFANDDLFSLANIELALWRNFIETSPAGIALHGNYSQTVLSIVPYAVVSLQQAFFNEAGCFF